MKRKLIVCLVTCLIWCIPLSYATLESWSYRIDRISASAMAYNGTHVLVGSSSGVYYLFNEYGEVVRQDDLGTEINSVDISGNNMIIGTKSATLILSFTGRKLSHFTSGPVLSVAISEDDSCAISGTDRNISIFPSLKSASEILTGTPVDYVSISPNGKKAAAATSDRIFLFTIGDTITSQDHEISFTTSLEFLRDGSLVAGTKDGFLYLIGKTVDKIGENLGSITTVETGDDLIVIGTSNRIYLYDSSGVEKTRFSVDKIVDCDISSNGFIVAASSQRLYLFDENGEALWQKDVKDIESVEISSDGKKMTVTTDDGILFLCNWTDTFKGTRLFPYPSREQYSFEDFKKKWQYSISFVDPPYIKQRTMRAAVGDVNGDGINEIVVGDGKNLVILDSEGKILSKMNAEEEVYHIALIDIDEDTVPEIFYTVNDGRYTIFALDFKNGEFGDSKEFDFTGYFGVFTKDKEEAAITPVVSYDIDNDGNSEILAVVCSGYTLNPRGILAFEYSSGDVEWFYESAVSLVIDAFCDIDEDGSPEIVLGSHSSCNGNILGDRDDCHAYLVVLNLNGKEVWSKEITSELKVVRTGVEDIDKDGKIEIVGTVLDANNVYGRIFVMDKNGKILYDKDGLDYSLSLGGIVDFDGDGFKEIVVTDSDGDISIYSYELELLETKSIATYQLSEVERINDIDGDRDKEIVVRVWDRRVIVLNSNLREEWSEEYESKTVPSVLLANVSGCGNDLLILIEKSLEMYSFQSEGEDFCIKFISPPTETPPPTSPPTETPPPTSPPTETPPPLDSDWASILKAVLVILPVVAIIIVVEVYFEKRKSKKKQKAIKSIKESEKELFQQINDINSVITKKGGDLLEK